MRKFSKILESKEEFLTKLGTSEEEIKDICSDLIDDGYVLRISNEYLGTNGHSYDTPNQTKNYYPLIDIELDRDTDNKNDYGDRTTKDKFNDVRMWNGGVFYEGDVNLLKMIYEIIFRFESMFTSEKAEVFYSIRNINDINIRITFGLENSTSPLDFGEIKKYLKNREIIANINSDYVIQDTTTTSNSKISLNISADTTASSKYYYEFVKSILDSTEKNNLNSLKDLAKKYAENIFKLCKESNTKIKGKYREHPGTGSYYVISEGKNLIEFKYNFEKEDEMNIVTKKGIFKNETAKIIIYSMELIITLNEN